MIPDLRRDHLVEERPDRVAQGAFLVTEENRRHHSPHAIAIN
ncbi:hypothetical protein FMEAI12_3410010 [Parafrankia sp. Ea1.12]|nr:hypothetical protein FMEAI12_3410010 [Parafrankia sp. Ea1.12]